MIRSVEVRAQWQFLIFSHSPDFEILVSAEKDEIIMNADRYRIAQVITNLVNNGIKYSAGKNILEIAIKLDQGQVSLSVRDYGIGISPEDRKQVFQKFYRANPGQLIEGLGIGLYLCYEIIVRHSGNIYKETELPGTTVEFTIPQKAETI